MSQQTGTIIIVAIVIILNLILMSGGHGGRGSDYYEPQSYDQEYDTGN